jgi:four helix bundle protein
MMNVPDAATPADRPQKKLDDPAPVNALRSRTKAFALKLIGFYGDLPVTTVAQILGKQALRSGTSVGAHYREACRARSVAEFVSKCEVALQEIDETSYWLELLDDSGLGNDAQLLWLRTECAELTAILVASVNTAKKRRAEA